MPRGFSYNSSIFYHMTPLVIKARSQLLQYRFILPCLCTLLILISWFGWLERLGQSYIRQHAVSLGEWLYNVTSVSAVEASYRSDGGCLWVRLVLCSCDCLSSRGRGCQCLGLWVLYLILLQRFGLGIQRLDLRFGGLESWSIHSLFDFLVMDFGNIAGEAPR